MERMIREDLKRLAAIGNHDLEAMKTYDVHHTHLARFYIRIGKRFIECGLKRIARL